MKPLPPPKIQLDGIHRAVRSTENEWLFTRFTPAAAAAAAAAECNIFIVHGYGEHCGRPGYDLLTRKLTNTCNVYLMDLQGHGWSGGERAVIKDVHHFADDVGRWIRDSIREQQQHQKKPLPTFLFGHSMGGLVSVLVAESPVYGPMLETGGLILSSPLLAPSADAASPAIKAAARVLKFITPFLALTPVNAGALSHDPTVGPAYLADPLNTVHGMYAITGVALLDAMEQAQTNWKSIKHRVLVMHGTADKLCSFNASVEFVASVASIDKKLIDVPDAYHELFHEPKHADKLVNSVIEWIKKRI